MTKEFLHKYMGNNTVGAEIGVWYGTFSETIVKKVKPKKLYLVDPYIFIPEYKGAWYGDHAGSQKFMDDVYDTVVDKFKDDENVIIIREKSEDSIHYLEKLDWVYIDGNHTYEYAKKDLELFYDLVKPGGYILGDDYVDGGWWNGGVKKAVNEFIDKNKNIKLIEIIAQQFVIKKNSE